MYGQGNFAPQFGQGFHTSVPPTHQHMQAPPPPPPFQQGPSAPRPTIVQLGPPPLQPHVGQTAPPVYPHTTPAAVQQGPPVQCYLNPPPPPPPHSLPPPPPPPPPHSVPPPPPLRQMHGSTPMAPSYSTTQQNFQWTQNVHHHPPPVRPPFGTPATGPEMLRHPPAPRVLPPPPSQGQALYGDLVHPSPSGGVQGLQHTPPPPTPVSSFFTPSAQESHMPSVGFLPPPPPPSSPPPGPPPLPPSSPPPCFGTPSSAPLRHPPLPPSSTPPNSPPPCFRSSSSATRGPPPLPLSSPLPNSTQPGSGTPSAAPLHSASELRHHSESGASSNKHSGRVADSGDRVVALHLIGDDASTHDVLSNCKGGTDCELGSVVEHGLSYLPPPPPRPMDEKIVRKIEVLCQYIAKNGPDFEDMTLQKEFGNPEFEFLFGGEPGSEAEVANEYFVWMKKKCSLTCKLHEGQQHNDSLSRPSRNDSSLQPDSLIEEGVAPSPADSDMDMEDDITQPVEEHRIYKSFESPRHGSDLISSELDTKVHYAPQNTAGHSAAKDAVSGNHFCLGSSGSVEHVDGSNISVNHDNSTFGRPLTVVDISVMNPVEDAEYPSDSNLENSSICPRKDLSQLNASAAAAVMNSAKVPCQLSNGASPFRLLQDYASDESSEKEDEPCLEDVCPTAVARSVMADDASLDGDMGSDFQMVLGSKGLSGSEKGFKPFSKSVVTSSMDMPTKSLDSSIELETIVTKADLTSIETGKAEQIVDDSLGNQESIDSGTSHKAFKQKNALGGTNVNATLESGKSQKEDARCTFTPLKVDEFGRLVREGASDSDSDDVPSTKRRGKRGRSRSSSRSPHDRRRRSHWRRKEKRSRSRSWSPKKRSRSRSPLRHGGEFGGDKARRDKGQLPDCFDFRRGKCYRGASCRYLHHDSDKSDGSRHYKSKLQYQEVPPSSKHSEKSGHVHGEVKRQEMHLYQDVPESNFGDPKDGNIYQKEVVSARNTGQLVTPYQDGKSFVTSLAESERAQEVTDQEQEALDIEKELVEHSIHLTESESESGLKRGKPRLQVESFSDHIVTDADARMLPGETSHDIASSIENSWIQQSEAICSDPVHQNTDSQPQQVDNSSPSDVTGSLSKPHSSENISSQSLAARELFPHIPSHPSQLLPAPPSVSHGTDAAFPPQLPIDFNMMQSSVNYPSNLASLENCPPHQSPIPYQHSHFSAPPNTSWHSLPPPPPPPLPLPLPLPQSSHPPHVNNLTMNAATASHGVYQQNLLPPRHDFPSQTLVRPYLAELPARSQVGELQHRTYPPSTLPVTNPMAQQFGGPSLVGEDRFTRLPMQGLISSNSFAQGNMHQQPMPFSRESPGRSMQSFFGDNLPPGDHLTPSSQGHPYLQQPSYGSQRPVVESVYAHMGEHGKINSTLSRYSSDFLDRNQSSVVSEFGGSRIPNYYNPYASTFDQPLSSKFSSNIFNQEQEVPFGNKYGASLSSSRTPVDGQGVGSLGSRNMSSSTNSAHAVGHILPRPSGDQYDPLFDSIEPSSNSFRKYDQGQKHEPTDDSDTMLRLSGSNKPFDVEENKQKEAGAVALTTSLDHDEYGETADAEVGAVENGSPSDPIDEVTTPAGDIEIDQVKIPGKSKKSKDSRSMKLFKGALADFVKEVLKPSWRQGNMSKEAFKTIVKKTVDKVSGAMKSHQIPKSQTKINQYIDSSQRKLTKLVMGYVDKYVKS